MNEWDWNTDAGHIAFIDAEAIEKRVEAHFSTMAWAATIGLSVALAIGGGLVGTVIAEWIGGTIGALMGAGFAFGMRALTERHYKAICKFFRIYER